MWHFSLPAVYTDREWPWLIRIATEVISWEQWWYLTRILLSPGLCPDPLGLCTSKGKNGSGTYIFARLTLLVCCQRGKSQRHQLRDLSHWTLVLALQEITSVVTRNISVHFVLTVTEMPLQVKLNHSFLIQVHDPSESNWCHQLVSHFTAWSKVLEDENFA